MKLKVVSLVEDRIKIHEDNVEKFKERAMRDVVHK